MPASRHALNRIIVTCMGKPTTSLRAELDQLRRDHDTLSRYVLQVRDRGNDGLALKLDAADVSAFALTLLDDADAAAARATLELDGGTYTPTLTNTTNLDASTAFACTYMQIGDAVFVAWRFEADATATGSCVMGMSLPVAANFSAASQLNGNGISSASNGVRITADTTNDRAQFSWTSSVTVNAAFNGTFGYIIP